MLFCTPSGTFGNNDVVDLSGAIFGGQGDVLDQVVALLVEEQTCGGINKELPYLPLEPGRFEDARENDERDKVPEGVEKRLKNRGVVHPSSLIESTQVRFISLHISPSWRRWTTLICKISLTNKPQHKKPHGLPHGFSGFAH